MNALEAYRADFPPDVFAALDEWARDAEARRARFARETPPLSIGIMGQVKAGKSSFLNQLLFNGQPLLPEAPTPETANLTRLFHAETPSFTAHFYSPESWAALERLADSDADDLVSRGLRALVREARRNLGEEIPRLLAQGTVCLKAEDVTDLLGRIGDYVGAAGRHTPLVEHTELGLPDPRLAGIEIVDTPGMNDPVVSRTEKTRAYMARCDVAFFLSRASQFLDASDQELLASQLPAKGVKRLVLVAAQFDGALADDGYDRHSLAESETRLRQRLARQAREHLEQLATAREKRGHADVAALLRSIREPIFASTFADAFATLPAEAWSPRQKHVHQQFVELAHDCWGGQAPTAEDWARISGFAALRQALDAASAGREQILAEQRSRLEAEIGRQRAHLLANLRTQAEDRLHNLRTHEAADLDAHARQAHQRLQAIATALQDFVRGQAAAARQQASEMLKELERLGRRAQTLEERTGRETRFRTVYVSDSKWWNLFSWGTGHYETYETSTTYRYLALADARENVRNFLDETRNRLLRVFDDLIAPAQIALGLRRTLLGVLDTRRDDFDPRGLRALIDTTLARLEWPQLNVPEIDPSRALAGLPDEVRDASEMSALRDQLGEIVAALQKQLAQQVKQGVDRACNELDRMASHLHDTLTESLAEELERLRAALADKNRQIERLSALLETIDREMGGAHEQTLSVTGG